MDDTLNTDIIEPMRRFRVLMFGGRYVDVKMIHGSIFFSVVPQLLPADTTKDKLIEAHKRSFTARGVYAGVSTQKLIDNLLLCELVDVEIVST